MLERREKKHSLLRQHDHYDHLSIKINLIILSFERIVNNRLLTLLSRQYNEPKWYFFCSIIKGIFVDIVIPEYFFKIN